MPDGGRVIEDERVIEAAARLLADWKGAGNAWWTADFSSEPELVGDDENFPTATPGLAVVRQAETVERARDSVSALPERVVAGMKDTDREALLDWERENPLNKNDGRNPYRCREFERWRPAKGIVVVPRTRPNRDLAMALSFADLPGPLEPLLLLYACQDWEQWPLVRKCATVCVGDAQAVDDAMSRILWRRAPVSQNDRAKQLGVRADTYRRRTTRAEYLLRNWLLRASQAFLHAVHGE